MNLKTCDGVIKYEGCFKKVRKRKGDILLVRKTKEVFIGRETVLKSPPMRKEKELGKFQAVNEFFLFA